MSYEINAPVVCDGSVLNDALTIEENGFVETKNFFKFKPGVVANVINISAADDLSESYVVQWPNVAPQFTQSLIVGEDGFSEQWYDLESTSTLIVRQNAPPGQFSTITDAISFVNTQANPDKVYTIWLAPGTHTATSPTLRFSAIIKGAGMYQTRLILTQLSFDNPTPSPLDRIFTFGVQDLAFTGGIRVVNNMNMYVKNVGLITPSPVFPMFTFVQGQYTTIYTLNLICERVWNQEIGPLDVPNFMIFSKTGGPQSLITSNVSISDISIFVTRPDSGFINPIFNFSDASGSILNIGEVFSNFPGPITSFMSLVRNGGVVFKDSLVFGNYTKLFTSNVMNSWIVVSQIDSSLKNDYCQFSSGLVPPVATFSPYFNNDNDIGPQKMFLRNQQTIGSSCLKYDQSDVDSRKQFSFFDDFTAPSFPYTDKKWRITTSSGGSISNTVTAASSSSTFRNGDIVLSTIASNSFVSLNRSFSSTPLTHGSFIRFESAVQPQSVPISGNGSSFVVGLGDNGSVFTGNVESAFANSAIYFGFAPDFTPSANWYCYTKNQSSIASLDSLVPLSSNLFTLEFNYKRLATPVIDYYINESLVGSLSSSIPISGSNVALAPVIKKRYTSGTGGGNVAVDYVSYYARSNLMRKL